MKHVILIIILGFSLSIAQKNHKSEEISSRLRSFAKISSGNYQPTQNQLQYDVKFYSINLNITPVNRYIDGHVQINSQILNPIDKMEFDLTKDLSIDSIYADGKKTSYTFTNNLLTVNLGRVFQKNETSEVKVYYRGNPGTSGFGSFGSSEYNGKRMVWTLSEAFGARDWWPCKDHPYDKADSVDINITVPGEMVVASNGKLINVIISGDKKTYYWQERYPISTYLVSITTYPYHTFSNYYRYSPTDSMEIKYFTVYDKLSYRYDNFELVPNMIKIFSEMFGEYPFIKEKYGHAEFPWGGGMEHQTCTSLGSFGEMIIVHELAHQWWGDMITCKDFHNIWLNEGFATYSEALYAEKAYGIKRYKEEMNGTKYFGSGKIYVDDLSNIWRIFSGDLTYNKASWVLHMLRHVVGDDTFFKILKEFSNSIHKYGAVDTEEFQKICESVFGKDLGWFFKQWIYEEYHPKYEFYYSKIRNGAKTDVSLTINQKQTNYIFKMPIDITVNTGFGDTTIVLFDSLKSQTFNFSVFGDVSKIELDKDEWILRTVEQLSSGIEENANPEKFVLYQNYPNPFNPATEILYNMPKNDFVTIKIYDLLGREISTLFSGKQEAGIHKFYFNALVDGKQLPSGVYFYKLTSGSFSDTKKMVLLR